MVVNDSNFDHVPDSLKHRLISLKTHPKWLSFSDLVDFSKESLLTNKSPRISRTVSKKHVFQAASDSLVPVLQAPEVQAYTGAGQAPMNPAAGGTYAGRPSDPRTTFPMTLRSSVSPLARSVRQASADAVHRSHRPLDLAAQAIRARRGMDVAGPALWRAQAFWMRQADAAGRRVARQPVRSVCVAAAVGAAVAWALTAWRQRCSAA